MSIPRPIGYIEVQRAWVGEPSSVQENVLSLIDGVILEIGREQPELKYAGSRLERTVDGAGAHHYNLYMSFEPRVAPAHEPLDPRNLNAADKADQIGDPARDNNIGWKEQRF